MPAIRPKNDLMRLTRRQCDAVQAIARGAMRKEAAHAMWVQLKTFRGYMSEIGLKYQCSADEVRVYKALLYGQIEAPTAQGKAPDFTEMELKLLRAVALLSTHKDIAARTGITLGNVGPQLRALRAKAGAATDAHMVGLAFSWKLLGSEPAPETVSPAGVETAGRR